jgi:DNA-binding response OmpR family regulator
MTTRIMIVDDEPAIGKLLVYQLRSFGYQASYVDDGLAALRRFALEQPDLVLLDVMMPQISGWELCRQIRACSSAPVIMLTAKGADPDVVTGLGAGADDYITKPFSMLQLQARIETALRRSASPRTPRGVARQQPRRYTPAHNDAYLLAPVERAQTSQTPAVEPRRVEQKPAEAPPQLLGQRMREARLRRGFSLHQVERACKVRWEFLQAIEQENFAYVPREELRRALKVYSEYLGLELHDLLGRPKPASRRLPIPPPFVVAMTIMVVIIAVGLYLL